MAKKKNNIENLFPIAEILDNGLVLSKNGDFSIILEVSLPNLFSLYNHFNSTKMKHDGDLLAINGVFAQAINLLPEYTILQKQDFFYREQVNIKETEINASTQYLQKYEKQHFDGRFVVTHKCLITITKTTEKGMLKTPSQPKIVGAGNPISKEVRQNLSKVSEFIETIDGFISKLSTLKDMYSVEVRKVTRQELVSTNESIGLYEQYMTLCFDKQKSPLYDVYFDPNGIINVGPKFSKIYTLTDLEDIHDSEIVPYTRIESLSTENTSITSSFCANIGLLLDVDHVYNQFIYITSKSEYESKLKKNKETMSSLADYDKNNLLNYNKIDEFEEYLAENKTKAVYCHLNVQVFSEDKQDLILNVHSKVLDAFNLMGIKCRESGIDNPYYFWAGIPGNAGDLPKEDVFMCQLPLATSFFNFETNISIFKPKNFGVILTDRHSGRPLALDLSDKPKEMGLINNYNKFIIAGSGGGKSFLTNKMIKTYHDNNSHLVVIDMGRSYYHQCMAKGGMFIEHTEKTPISINPFYIDFSHVDGSGDITREEIINDFKSLKRDFLISVLVILWKNSGESFSKSEQAALTDIIGGYYSKLEEDSSIFPCFDSFYEFVRDTYKKKMQNENIPSAYFDIDNFLFVLKQFYKEGEYGHFLNSRENIGILNESFVCVELATIQNSPIYFPVMVLMIIQSFNEKLFTQMNIRKIIVFEEAWSALMNPAMAGYVDSLFRTVRKYNGEAWIITQNPQDLDSPFVKKSIITNTDIKIILDVRKFEKQFDIVSELLSLSTRDKNLILSINRNPPKNRRNKEVFISFNGGHQNVYGVEVSKAEFFLFNTDGDKAEERNQLIKQNNGSYEKAIVDYYNL